MTSSTVDIITLALVQHLGMLQIAWEYIYTFPVPLVAKTLALGSANGTAVNTFFLRSGRLANSNDTAVVAPNHDTIYSQAWLDLSQVLWHPRFSCTYPVHKRLPHVHTRKVALNMHHHDYLCTHLFCPS